MTDDFAERLKKQKEEKAAAEAKAAHAARSQKEIQRQAAEEKRVHLEALAGDLKEILDKVAEGYSDDRRVTIESGGPNPNYPAFLIRVTESAGVYSTLGIKFVQRSLGLSIEHHPAYGVGPNMVWGTEQDARLPNKQSIEDLVLAFMANPSTQPVITWA